MSIVKYQIAKSEQINCNPGRAITREQLITFCDGMFIEKLETLLITGAAELAKATWYAL